MEKRHYPAAVMTTVFAAGFTLYLHSLTAVPKTHPASDAIRDLSASRYLEQVKYLASDEMKSRGDGSPELDKAADYIASQFRRWGLRPMGDSNSYFQHFEITTGALAGPKTELQVNRTSLKVNQDFVPLPFSNTAVFDGPLVFAGYGITAPELQYDDYQTIDATGAIVLVLRHQPQETQDRSPFNSSQHNTFINKAINAKQHGARGIIFITDLNHEDEEVGRATRAGETDDFGIPSFHAKREAVLKLLNDAGKNLAAIQKKIDMDLQPQSFDLPAARA